MKKFLSILFAVTMMFTLNSCFSEKDSPFYDSEWVMQSYDAQGQIYFHNLTLKPNHEATLSVLYDKTYDGLYWSGKYKINSKKIEFDFTDCVRFKNNEITDRVISGKVIKYYNGEFFYSLAEAGQNPEVSAQDRMALIRPKGYFYGGNKDILGNQMEEFVKIK